MRLIIDTDAGVDDAQAIMMALRTPGARLEAITTVTGNVHVDWVTRNVCTVLDVIDAPPIPIFRGASQPLLPGNWHAEEAIHGRDGLGNYQNRPPTRRVLEPEPAALALVRLADAAPGVYTLVALGPLTNLALACRLDPAFPSKIARFVFMGGAYAAMGNTRHVAAEFNIYCDPEAAAVTLDAFPEATMVSWETTLHHPFSWEQYDALTTLPTPAARFMRATTAGTVDFLRGIRRVPGYLLPDPLAMAVALEPEIVQASDFHYVSVELGGVHARGQTAVDHFGASGKAPNTHIVTALDVQRVYDRYRQMLA